MKNKGFSLVELLVVMAIIGILASVILSSIQKSQEIKKVSSPVVEDKFARTSTSVSLTNDEPECGVECQKQIYSNKMIEECISRYAYNPTN